jgi:hypothetical protein
MFHFLLSVMLFCLYLDSFIFSPGRKLTFVPFGILASLVQTMKKRMMKVMMDQFSLPENPSQTPTQSG